VKAWKTTCLILLAMAITVTASAQNWGGPPGDDSDGKLEAGASKAAKATGVLPASDSLKAAVSGVMKRRPFFNMVKRRRLGITIWSITPEVVAMHKAGELAGLSQDEVAIEVTKRLAAKRPQVYAAEKAAWEVQNPVGDGEEGETFLDRIIALIIRLLPLILMFF